MGILDKYMYKYIDHILLYTSLVCPDYLTNENLESINDSLGLNVLDEEVLNNLNDNTKELISNMSSKSKQH